MSLVLVLYILLLLCTLTLNLSPSSQVHSNKSGKSRKHQSSYSSSSLIDHHSITTLHRFQLSKAIFSKRLISIRMLEPNERKTCETTKAPNQDPHSSVERMDCGSLHRPHYENTYTPRGYVWKSQQSKAQREQKGLASRRKFKVQKTKAPKAKKGGRERPKKTATQDSQTQAGPVNVDDLDGSTLRPSAGDQIQQGGQPLGEGEDLDNDQLPDLDHRSQEDQFPDDQLPSAAQGDQDTNQDEISSAMGLDLNEETLVDNDQDDAPGHSGQNNSGKEGQTNVSDKTPNRDMHQQKRLVGIAKSLQGDLQRDGDDLNKFIGASEIVMSGLTAATLSDLQGPNLRYVVPHPFNRSNLA